MKLNKQSVVISKAVVTALVLTGIASDHTVAWAQTAPKPLSQVVVELPAPTQSPKRKVIPDIWVMEGNYVHLPDRLPAPKPVLTTESFQQLRETACVADVTLRRYDGPIALLAKDGKPLLVHMWVVDTAGLNARGFRVNSKSLTVGSYYLSPDIASLMGLPQKAAPGHELERVSYMSAITSRDGVPVIPPEPIEVMIDAPAGQLRSLKLPYGGTVEADLKILSRPPQQIGFRFEPLLRSKVESWTSLQLLRQQHNNGTVVYVRTKPGVVGAAREACRARLDAHMQTWVKGLPRTTWTLVPLED